MSRMNESLLVVVGDVIVVQEGEPIGAGHRRGVSGERPGLGPSDRASV